ncbi:DUF3084 domain-containing protein [Halonatronum saccharophilum]|uniref:DUF3084 domain-containing protein n=1 Tax=Halonatronum saccharophilum TaxID=150060 RepID=UPI000489B491|nr:DUF3084 domain-containing protein [Halonatronum saccharophilum]
MYGLKLIITLVITAGVIAYVGDKIGMKIGKKRLSIFGLRPKHTSILITVVTGMLIAISSLMLLMAASEEVRMALFDMRSLLERLDGLQVELEDNNRELFELRDDINLKVADLALLEQDRSRLEGELDSLQEDYTRTRESKVELGETVERLNLQKDELDNQIDNLAHNLTLFGRRYFNSLTGDILYQKGDILLERSISVDQGYGELNSEINKLLEKVAATVREEGIELGEGIKPIEYNQNDFDQVVEILDEREGRVIVRLLASQNTFKDEKLGLEFDLYQDYKVYSSGDTIIEVKFDSDGELAQVDKGLQDLLQELNLKAIRKGILADNKGQVGELGIIRLYSIIDDLLIEGDKRVKVVANEDIWRSDRLEDNIDFKVLGDSR